MAKSIFDYMSKEDYDKYNEIEARARAAKEAAPKAPRAAKTMTIEQKIEAAQKRKAALEAKVAALMAAQANGGETVDAE